MAREAIEGLKHAGSTAVSDLKDWLIEQGLAVSDPEPFVAALGRRLAEHMPLARLMLGASTLDPNIRGVSVTWTDAGEVLVDASAHGAEGEASFRKSPIHFLRESGRLAHCWALSAGDGIEAHPILARLARDEGIATYALRLVAFPNELHMQGIAVAFATRVPDGFTPDHHALVDALLPAIGLVAYRLLLSNTARDMLHIYVGPRTGDRILAGAVHRGEGQSIEAAILFADLKGFTELSEAQSAESVVELLNEHFDALDAPIAEQGGEILKFLGDGLLAVFPLDGEERDACRRALRATQHALVATAALNALREAAGRPRIDLDIALHVGKVFYGNIGASRRLDFTVIGSAVNLASRIEKLCDRLGRNLVLSEAFATLCGVPTVPLGTFELKGIAAPQPVFGYDGGE